MRCEERCAHQWKAAGLVGLEHWVGETGGWQVDRGSVHPNKSLQTPKFQQNFISQAKSWRRQADPA